MTMSNMIHKDLSRRECIGGLGGLAALGISAKAEAAYVKAPSRQPATARSVIYIFLGGGLSHVDSFDVKPERPEIQGPMKSIATSVDGLQFSEPLSLCAKMADKLAVIHSMSTSQGAHEQGVYAMHTSERMRSTLRHPSLSSWVSKVAGKRSDNLPSSVLIHGPSRLPDNGYWDPIHAPLRIQNVDRGLANLGEKSNLNQTEQRYQQLQRFNRRFMDQFGSKEVDAYEDMYREALLLMKSEESEVFDISLEKTLTREVYGQHRIGKACLLARRLVEKEVRFIEVYEGGWDTHANNFDRLGEKLPQLDQALGALVHDLTMRGLLDQTLIVLTTEFGRSPKLNNRDLGRDHHPAAFSSVLIGGGVRGGVVHGQTDERGMEILHDAVSPADLNATIASALGLPLSKTFTTDQGRPFRLANDGKPLRELFI